MRSYFGNFLTNKNLFFDQFGLAAKNLVEMANIQQSLVNLSTLNEFDMLYKQIDKKENTGDDITHKIYLFLNKIVFTPLNRPDIHNLASGIDDVADAIHEASGRMCLYNIDEFSFPIKQLANIVLSACLEIEKAIILLRSARKTGELSVICLQIKNYGQQADQIYYHALADLFSDEKNAIKLLKYREILSSLEATVVKCKNVTEVFNTIMLNG